jgi:hypothetical protein
LIFNEILKTNRPNQPICFQENADNQTIRRPANFRHSERSDRGGLGGLFPHQPEVCVGDRGTLGAEPLKDIGDEVASSTTKAGFRPALVGVRPRSRAWIVARFPRVAMLGLACFWQSEALSKTDLNLFFALRGEKSEAFPL